MIRKILTGEYLKPYGEMSENERVTYSERVGEWLSSDGERLLTMTDRPMARAQSLMSMSARWSKEDCEAVHEGARLMTALVNVADTWLPSQLWAKSAWRAVRHVASLLSEVKSERGAVKNEGDAKKEKGRAENAEIRRKADAARIINPDKQNDKPSKTQKREEVISAGQDTVTAVPVRPKHIDQYVHLLPKGTQERAAKVKDLLRDLDVARENARRLMEAGEHGDKVAQWSKAATQLDEKVGRIYKELDTEWEKLVADGRAAVDAFGNAYVTAPQNGTSQNSDTQDTRSSLTSEQKARRRELRKWLIDLRRGKEGEAREKRIEQWKENWKEYLTLEPLELALKDEKVVAAAAHFGIEINS